MSARPLGSCIDFKRFTGFEATWHHVVMACESPIEIMMVEALRTVAADRHIRIMPAYPDADRTQLVENLPYQDFWLIPQRNLGPYRADFVLLGWFDGIATPLAIECDGLMFHYGSQAQVNRDKRRDAEINAMGIGIMRFLGARIKHEPEICAAEIFDEFKPLRETGHGYCPMLYVGHRSPVQSCTSPAAPPR